MSTKGQDGRGRADPGSPRLTFFLDVDNTLLDNDAAKEELARQLVELLGKPATIHFWETYERVRLDEGMVDLPQTLVRFLEGVTDRDLRFRLADLVMGFRYERFLFPGTLATIAHLRKLGKVAILSDGDPAFQPAKIARSGLAQAVDGYVLVYPHKEEHLPEITTAFAADHYVLVDDKPTVIARVAARLTLPLTTVLVRQGKYAEAVPHGDWPGAGLTVAHIGDLRRFDVAAFVAAGRGTEADVLSLP
jgi:FMN phosphatase YigB (HAD superfamily)